MGWGGGEHSSRGERAWTGPESQTELFWGSCLTSALTFVSLGGRGGPCWAQAGGRHSEPGGWLLPLSSHVTFVILCLRVSFLLCEPKAHKHLQQRLEGGHVMLPMPPAPCGRLAVTPSVCRDCDQPASTAVPTGARGVSRPAAARTQNLLSPEQVFRD